MIKSTICAHTGLAVIHIIRPFLQTFSGSAAMGDSSIDAQWAEGSQREGFRLCTSGCYWSTSHSGRGVQYICVAWASDVIKEKGSDCLHVELLSIHQHSLPHVSAAAISPNHCWSERWMLNSEHSAHLCTGLEQAGILS